MPLHQGVALERTDATSYATDGIKIFAASLFIALCAQISIPLFFTPVPFSFGPFAIAMVGWMLGWKRGALAVLAYLSEGAMGLPVFTLGNSGLVVLLGPRGGYLFSYILAVMVAGYFAKGTTNFGRLAIGFLGSSIVTYSIGLPWLSFWVGTENVLKMGFFPFIIGDMLKLGLAISCVKIWAANTSREATQS